MSDRQMWFELLQMHFLLLELNFSSIRFIGFDSQLAGINESCLTEFAQLCV
jgi:hypothetical protein